MKDTRIAVIAPKTKQLVIGKQNSETGVVVGINKEGKMVTVEKPKGEWKKGADLGDGWRLPTKDELNVLYENKDKIGGFASNY